MTVMGKKKEDSDLVGECQLKEKHPGGAPRQFKSPEDMQMVIDDYFESCFQEFTVAIKDDEGKKIGERLLKKQVEPFTITGLALALNLTRQGVLNYEGREEFVDTVKRAKLKCENYAEKTLFNGQGATGPIFNLINNYGWKNTTQQEISGPGGASLPLTVVFGKEDDQG
jgi:hypothetical protein